MDIVTEMDHTSHLKLAIETARKAAELLSGHDREAVATSEHDVKIRADVRLHSFIEQKLSKNSPFPVLSEEGKFPKIIGEEISWIVDPLDGSVNFSRGLPVCCISIALWAGHHPLLGIVYDFNRKEMFTGLPGQGAWLNDQPITVSLVRQRSEALLCTGFPSDTDFSEPKLAQVVEQIRSYKKIRLLGSAALSLAYVAAGRVDVYQEDDIALWDVAAGLALVQGAGGRIEYQPTKDKRRFKVRASNHTLI